MESEIVLVSGEEDWEGVYVNGTLFWEGHSVPGWVVIDALASAGLPARTFTVSHDWMIDEGRLPKSLSDIPEEAKVG